MNPRFSAKNDKGRLFITDHERFVSHLATLPQDVYLVVGDAKEKRERSSSQNAYYFGVVVKMFSDETGYSKEESHDFLKKHVMEQIGFMEKITVHTAHGDMTEVVARSTKSLTTKEMEEYLEGCRMFCSIELGLTIPTPQEVE